MNHVKPLFSNRAINFFVAFICFLIVKRIFGENLHLSLETVGYVIVINLAISGLANFFSAFFCIYSGGYNPFDFKMTLVKVTSRGVLLTTIITTLVVLLYPLF